jgi:hypothetical protein
VLQCCGNYLTTLPASIAASCPSLEQLGLDRNRLAYLPHSLGGLTGLLALSADGNPHLRCPPPEVNCMPSVVKIRSAALPPSPVAAALLLRSIFLSNCPCAFTFANIRVEAELVTTHVPA